MSGASLTVPFNNKCDCEFVLYVGRSMEVVRQTRSETAIQPRHSGRYSCRIDNPSLLRNLFSTDEGDV